MSFIVLPKRNRAQIVHNYVTQCWEVQRAGLVVYTGQLGRCELYCETRNLTVTNLGAIEGVRATHRALITGATA